MKDEFKPDESNLTYVSSLIRFRQQEGNEAEVRRLQKILERLKNDNKE